jgi:hypothetical protein
MLVQADGITGKHEGYPTYVAIKVRLFSAA